MPERSEERVPVQWKGDDYLVAGLKLALGEVSQREFAALPQIAVDFITKGQIEKFCGPCDLFEDGLCRLGLQDQTRYVARQWCGYSSVNRKGGVMTEKGFRSP